MPELGKATYFLVADTRQFDTAMAHADEVSAASSTKIGRSMDRATVATGKLAASAGAGSARVVRAEEGMAAAASASTKAVQRAHGAAESSYVRMSATGTKAYERMRLGPLAAIGITLFEGVKTFKENANAAAILDKAYSNNARSAHISRDALKGVTEELEKNTLASRAEIQGILALSMGFHDVTDKARFAQTVLDTAALTHKQGEVIAKAYGRALEDPANGLTKLGKAGLIFGPAQKAMAKQITETNGLLAGQAYVMQQVEMRTKGMAKAAADKAPWVQLFKQFKEIAASMVGVILPVFTALLKQMNAHKTAVKVLVGTLIGLAAIYVTVKTAEKAWSLITAAHTAILGAKAVAARAVAGVTATVVESDMAAAASSRALAGAMVGEEVVAGELALTLRGVTAANYQMAESAIAGEAAMAKGTGGGSKIISGLKGIATTGNIATVAILATAAALAYMGKKAWDAYQNMKQAQANIASDQNVALTAYAHEVNTLIKGGMERSAARIKADSDVFNRLGIHVGKTMVDGVAHALSDGATKLQVKMKEVMDGLASTAESASVALSTAIAHGAPKEILDQLSQASSDAAYDAAHGASGAAEAVRAAHEKLLAAHKAWLEKMKGLAQTAVQDLIDTITTKLQNAKSGLKSSFENLATVMFRAFDAVTEKGLSRFDAALQKFNDKIQKAIAKANKDMDKALAKANDALTTQGAALTPAEAQLKALQDKQNATAQQETLADAQSQLAGAKTPAEIASAQRAVRDAQLAIQMSALERQAAIERAAKDKETDAKRQALQDQADAERQAYQDQMDRMQKAYEARINQAKLDYASERETYKNHLAQWLQAEEVWLSKHPQQWRRVFGQLVAVFGPDVKAAGKLIGRGFITQFRDAVNDTAKKALRYSGALASAANALGRGLADGVVGGMKTLAPKLYREMLIQVNKAMKQFQLAYGIKSPSKKTHEDIGMPLGQGVVIGFAKAVAPLTRNFSLGTATMSGYDGNLTSRPTARPTSTFMGGTMSPAVVQRSGARIATEGGGSATRPNVQVIQNIKRVDPDPFQLAHEARFAADGVFG